MICDERVPTLQKAVCGCSNKEEDFIITRWSWGLNLQEYRCQACGNVGLLDIRENKFMVEMFDEATDS